MKETVRQHAKELGFDDCRFTTAEPPDHAAEFQNWLTEKQHGEMAYLERNAHKRVKPQEVLPGAKTVITLAASYSSSQVTDAQITNHAPRLAAPKRSEGGNTQHGVI